MPVLKAQYKPTAIGNLRYMKPHQGVREMYFILSDKSKGPEYISKTLFCVTFLETNKVCSKRKVVLVFCVFNTLNTKRNN